MRELRRGVSPPGGGARGEQAYPDGDQGQVDQLDHAHVPSGAGHRRDRRGIGEVRFGTVLVVVPAVVQSHPASVAQVGAEDVIRIVASRARL